MNKWFYFNLLLLVVAGWKVLTNNTAGIQLHIVFGFIGLIFILFNWTRHAVFSTIRNTPSRVKKIKFATVSKKVLPFHRWTGTIALLLIGIHAVLVINQFGFYWGNSKIVSGAVTGSVLAAVVVTGWMRRARPSGRKRMAHLWLGLTMFFPILLHLIL